jgi:hypothetical protein
LNLIQVQGYGATAAGAALLPFIVIMSSLSRWAGQLVDRHGPRLPLTIGPAIAAAGFAALTWPDADSGGWWGYWAGFFPGICVLGFGMTVTVAPLTTTVMNALDAEWTGTASGVNNAVSRTAGLLAIAALGIALAWAFDARLDAELSRIDAPREVLDAVRTQRGKLAGLELPTGLAPDLSAALKSAVGNAFVCGFRWVMALSALLSLLGAASAWWLIGDGRKKPRARRDLRSG